MYLEVVERPQWARLYWLGRLRSCSHMLRLVSNCGSVLKYAIYCWSYTAVYIPAELLVCVEENHELFTNIRGRGGAASTRECAQCVGMSIERQ